MQFSPTTFEETIDHVRQTYKENQQKRINNVWLTVMVVVNEIIELNGSNKYKIPHIGKEALKLPLVLLVSDIA